MVWTGTWVAERLGVELIGDEALPALLGLALRRNPKRAHLLVSSVLGKHVPQRPSVVYGSGLDLGRRVRALLGDEEAARAVVLGYAETATALGHAVADGLGLAPYLHSTRRPVAGVARAGGFEESHSHATSHLLLPEDPKLLAGDGPLVLVDDEFSTGNTVLNTVRALHERYPRDRYVVVALVDMRSAADLGRLDAFAAEIGARVDLISGAAGTVRLPEGVLEKGQALVAEHERAYEPGAGSAPGPTTARGGHEHVRVALDWPEGLPDGGRHGFTPDQPLRLETALPAMAVRITVAQGGAAAGKERGATTGAQPPVPAVEAQPSTAGAQPGPSAGAQPGTAVEAQPGSTAGAQPGPSAAGPRVLVLGFEELMYAPLRLGTALEEAGHDVRYSTTTRSPVLAVDDPGYAIRTRLVFPAHDDPADGPGERYAYNVAGAGFDAVVLVVDSTADTPALHAPDGLLAQLAAHIPRVVLAVVPSYTPTATASPYVPYDATPGATGVTEATEAAEAAGATGATRATRATRATELTEVTEATEAIEAIEAIEANEATTEAVEAPERSSMLPEPLRGPAFSSYAPEEVGWLLQDLSDVELEAPTEEREDAIQSGGAHSAESLPVEYQPSDRYQELFHAALETSAARIARAVGTVTETVLAERERPGHRPVLVSLARAGTPVGVLMRRWAQARHGLDLPHYAVSIVRGRGIDANALRWLAAHHDPADVVFVDGWTGKGAITRELADAIKEFEAAEGVTGFDPEIAVLADPGSCVRTYGTREDFLIPSACLNSTVSGLISRTVLRADLVGPNDFHGGKFYRELAGADVSGAFLDARGPPRPRGGRGRRARAGGIRAGPPPPPTGGGGAPRRESQ
ncbi:phosphoribosyltransferase domain-containing protein, partial [Streptomyces sp. NPDC059556]|uniref:phosphoribosyltransferase domain-containing protein n=1 Tax=Streptomyces sp. NPDC059556 TaxID=3346863 RepID=UPI0036B9519C